MSGDQLKFFSDNNFSKRRLKAAESTKLKFGKLEMGCSKHASRLQGSENIFSSVCLENFQLKH